jgi:hypothetical protein
MGNLISASETTITTAPIYIEQPLAKEIISKQQTLITNLEDTIKQSSNALVIDASENVSNPRQQLPTNTIEQFTIVNPISDYYTPPFSLANTNAPEVKDYVDAYNKSVALLDDPNQETQVNFDTYMHLQNKKLNELQNAINSFPTNGNINNPIKAIKNLKTSTGLNVEEYPDPTNKNNKQPSTYIGNGAPNYPNYLIYGNNGCLQYTKGNNANTPATWAFQPCNSNQQEQRFTMSKIHTLEDYNSKITDSNNKNYKISDVNSVIMDFYVVNPEIDQNQCMTLNNDGLSVMPCTLDASQRFKPFYHTITP